MENKPPLSPHIQIYKWHISSLVSISHRITGIINIIAITFFCLLASLLVFGESNYEYIYLFLSSLIGKFIILGLTWSFSFQALSEIRHLIMDLGYGFELKTTKITGFIVIIILTLIYFIRKTRGIEKYSFIIILGGALGNVFDRFFYSAVPDFIDIHYNNFHWFIFNVADIFITLGVILLVYIEIFLKNKKSL